MNLTEIFQAAGFFGFAGICVTAWFKWKTDSGSNENKNWSAIVEGYKEQVRFFSEQVSSIRSEFETATEKYGLTIEKYEKENKALERDRDRYRELYLQSDRKKVEYKEKYEAIVLKLKERGGDTFENEFESKV